MACIVGGWGPPILEGGSVAAAYRLTPWEARLIAVQRHPPEFAARAAVIYDATLDRLLLAQDAHRPLAPASLTKMMTALVVRRRLSLDETVQIPPEALDGTSAMKLRPGERLRVRTLLYGMLMASDNVAAAVLARAAAGDTATFVSWMNEEAAAMGLEGTHFVNPHGMDAVGHVSTAWDLARIARALLADPVLARIVATREIELEGHRILNRNQLLFRHDNVVGVKTGTTVLAGECLVAAFQEDGHTVITVVLGARDRYAVTEALWAYYRRVYVWTQLRLPPGAMNRVIGPWGRRQFRARDDVWRLMPRWAWSNVRLLREVNLPTRASGAWRWPATAGKAVFTLGPYPIGELDLIWEDESASP